jgi:hypothetical protein
MHKRHSLLLTIACLFILMLLSSTLVSAQEGATLIVEQSTAAPGETAQITVAMENGANVGAFDMALRYDPAVIRFVEGKTGEVAGDALLELNESEPGLLLIALADVNGLSGDGVVFAVSFDVAGQPGDQTSILVDRAEAYHYELLTDIPLQTIDGGLTVAPAQPDPDQGFDFGQQLDATLDIFPFLSICGCTLCAGVIILILALVLILIRRRRQE